LYHVKKMGSSSYNNSVGDVYEVSGQAIKSVTWFTTKGKLLEKFTSRHNSGHCIVKKGGNFKTMIKEIKTSGKVLRGCICIVQPGIKKSKAIPARIQEVLAATDSYVKKAGKVNRLRIIGEHLTNDSRNISHQLQNKSATGEIRIMLLIKFIHSIHIIL